MEKTRELSVEVVAETVVEFLITSYPSDYDAETLPRDAPLLELGILDSFGVLNLISFAEETWSIQVANDEITPDNFGTIDSIADLVVGKLGEGCRPA